MINNFEPKPKTLEHVKESITLATEADLSGYKKIRKEAISGPDAYLLGVTSFDVNKENSMQDTELLRDIISDDTFVMLAQHNSEVVGMVRAQENSIRVWMIGWVYVKSEFRQKGISKKMITESVYEAQRRGASRVIAFVKVENDPSRAMLKSLGFKKVDTSTRETAQGIKPYAHLMELYLIPGSKK